VVQDAARDELAHDPPVVTDPQQQADRRHLSAVVDPHGDEVDIEDRQLVTGRVEVLAAQPRAVTVQFEGHGPILPRAAPGRSVWAR